jgi:hypothetical protein
VSGPPLARPANRTACAFILRVMRTTRVVETRRGLFVLKCTVVADWARVGSVLEPVAKTPAP